MRKIFILALIVILVGCGKKEEAPTTYSINYNDDNYQIYMPYKKGVGNNYIINNNVVDFDINTIEKGLIQLSTNHFTIDKYYYQEGQYLKEKDLKTLLSKDNLNDNEKIKIDNNSVKPTLKSAVAGDITFAIGYRTMTDILYFIRILDKVIEGFANPDNLLYGPEIKFYSNQLEIDENFETSIKGL